MRMTEWIFNAILCDILKKTSFFFIFIANLILNKIYGIGTKITI